MVQNKKLGTVKWFNSTKGYGFIEALNKDGDIFVHISDIFKSGLNTLKQGDKVSYREYTKNSKTNAIDIELLDGAS